MSVSPPVQRPDPIMDLTVFGNVEKNPGPTDTGRRRDTNNNNARGNWKKSSPRKSDWVPRGGNQPSINVPRNTNSAAVAAVAEQVAEAKDRADAAVDAAKEIREEAQEILAEAKASPPSPGPDDGDESPKKRPETYKLYNSRDTAVSNIVGRKIFRYNRRPFIIAAIGLFFLLAGVLNITVESESGLTMLDRQVHSFAWHKDRTVRSDLFDLFFNTEDAGAAIRHLATTITDIRQKYVPAFMRGTRSRIEFTLWIQKIITRNYRDSFVVTWYPKLVKTIDTIPVLLFGTRIFCRPQDFTHTYYPDRPALTAYNWATLWILRYNERVLYAMSFSGVPWSADLSDVRYDNLAIILICPLLLSLVCFYTEVEVTNGIPCNLEALEDGRTDALRMMDIDHHDAIKAQAVYVRKLTVMPWLTRKRIATFTMYQFSEEVSLEIMTHLLGPHVNIPGATFQVFSDRAKTYLSKNHKVNINRYDKLTGQDIDKATLRITQICFQDFDYERRKQPTPEDFG
jgi:hypothetical protein